MTGLKRVTGTKSHKFLLTKRMKAEKRNKLNGWNYLPRKIWADEIEWCRSWTNGSLTKMTNSLWQCVFCEKQKNERKGGGFYRRSARKTKRCFDPRYKPTERQRVSCTINASGQLVRTLYTDDLILSEPSSHKPCHRLRDISTIIL